MTHTRYAIVGTGTRSNMFITAILGTYQEHAQLVGLCDPNQMRMDYYNTLCQETYKLPAIPSYKPTSFEQMIREQKVDVIIVSCIDRAHHEYIIRAMEAGCDVISEKPMTIDVEKCRAILNAEKRTGKKLRVTFNYRYAPRNSRVKELLMQGAIGKVLSVHFEWTLSTSHGADYFRRWHRDKNNSGGLMVHKSTHHFDLINWWLDTTPVEVYGMGKLGFYGRENAEQRGITQFYDRGTYNTQAKDCPFAMDLESPDYQLLQKLFLHAEKEDAYIRDRSVFSDGISIEDDMSVLVRYANHASMSYHLCAYSPNEGYRVCFNGTEGRLELSVEECSYISGQDNDPTRADVWGGKDLEIQEPCSILLRRHFSKPIECDVPAADEGGHGGGDTRMLDDIFLPQPEPDPLHRAADHLEGARSILTGIAANKSFATGAPVRIEDLFSLSYLTKE